MAPAYDLSELGLALLQRRGSQDRPRRRRSPGFAAVDLSQKAMERVAWTVHLSNDPELRPPELRTFTGSPVSHCMGRSRIWQRAGYDRPACRRSERVQQRPPLRQTRHIRTDRWALWWNLHPRSIRQSSLPRKRHWHCCPSPPCPPPPRRSRPPERSGSADFARLVHRGDWYAMLQV